MGFRAFLRSNGLRNLNTQIGDVSGLACQLGHAMDFGGPRAKAVDDW